MNFCLRTVTSVASHSKQTWFNKGSSGQIILIAPVSNRELLFCLSTGQIWTSPKQILIASQCQTVRKLNEHLFCPSTGQVCHLPEVPISSQYIRYIRQKQQPVTVLQGSYRLSCLFKLFRIFQSKEKLNISGFIASSGSNICQRDSVRGLT